MKDCDKRSEFGPQYVHCLAARTDDVRLGGESAVGALSATFRA